MPCLAKQKSGRPKKGVNNGANQLRADDDVASQKVGQKRPRLDEASGNRGGGTPSADQKVISEPAFSPRRLFTDLVAQVEDVTPPPVPKRQKKTGDQRSLPARGGRNTNPAAAPGVKPATRRSHAEVEAERQAKIKEAEEAYLKYKATQLALAQLHVDEENAPESPNLRLSAAVKRKRSKSVISGSPDASEDFDLEAVSGSSGESELSDEPRSSKPKVCRVHCMIRFFC